MIGQIVYVKGHEESEKQASEAQTSFKKWGWDTYLHEGLTWENVENSAEYKDYKIVENSRLLKNLKNQKGG